MIHNSPAAAFQHLKLSACPYNVSIKQAPGIVAVLIHCDDMQAASEVRNNRKTLAQYLKAQQIKANHVSILVDNREKFAFDPIMTLATAPRR